MKDLARPSLMYLKAALFLAIGVIAAVLLIVDSPHLRTVALMAVMVWAFARVYYFAFYVIERYIDPSYRFSGLISAAVHILTR